MAHDHETMQRRMKLSDEEFVRICAEEDAQARAARARAPRSAAPATRSTSMIRKSVSSAENERWLADQLRRHGRAWLRYAT